MEWELCQTQRSNDKFLTAIHHHGVVTNDEQGVVFRCPSHIFCRLNKDISFAQLKEKALRKINPDEAIRKEVSRIRYRKINCLDDGFIRYSAMDIRSDDDVRTMMEAHANVPMGRQILELYVDVVNSEEAIMHLLREPPPQPAAARQQRSPNRRVIRHTCTLYCQGNYEVNENGVYFDAPNVIHTWLDDNITTFNELHNILLEHAQVEGEGQQDITEISYRSPQIRQRLPIKWWLSDIKTDNDVQIMFRKHRQFKESTRRPLELCIKTTLATDEIIRRVIPPVIRWPLPENVWWKRN